jgi:hypothetical protein
MQFVEQDSIRNMIEGKQDQLDSILQSSLQIYFKNFFVRFSIATYVFRPYKAIYKLLAGTSCYHR